MNTKRLFPLLAGTLLLLSTVACSPSNVADNTTTQTPGIDGNATALPSELPATPIPTEPAAESAGACQNPYLPVVVGASWNYNLTGPIPDTFTRSILSVDATGFTDQDVFGTGVTRQGKWTCENGNLTALNPASGSSANVSTENLSADFQTTAASGITLPATIAPGDSWTQTGTIEGVQTLNDQQIPSKNEFTYACTALGVESVTVPAGTFEALHLDCQITTNITITMAGNPIQTSFSFTGSNWYAAGVGLVKTTTSGSDLDSTIELLSYNIP